MGQENFREMRKAMVVSQLRTTDVSDPLVIAAMSEVPREDFVPAASRNVAYSDRGVSVGNNRSLNAPLSTGRLLTAAELRPDDRVLLIGAATGYTAAVLSRIVGQVTAVEQSARLVTKAEENLEGLANVTVHKGELDAGCADSAPYSVIVVDGVIEQVPDALVAQLEPEGRLVAAIADRGVARLALGRKAGNIVGYQYFADCGGIVLPGFETAQGFEF
ncbi:protein-L-isoaspartate(D-aspartate) O-methyltransferase [Parasphingorhabdus marina DSM 22363]|uniref:Protein-L-isoaspartate O-methyltransferase n=2 Tax=Parasphingorhabdus marina TaxID=394732 RepID=A0A1N6HUP7_9SPHN|nr:protein-L-isoaspartate(D-aspartate) O-methyltransferase [Parasphingorhabdus marina DSM 22363]